MANLLTGLVGFSLKKDFLGDTLYFRTTTTYDYEFYATDFTGWSPTNLKTAIYNDFAANYSGVIQVRLFEIPAEPNSINDANRIQKYKAIVDIKSYASGLNDHQPELGTPYYTGLDTVFWTNYGVSFLDFHEDFNFETSENGTTAFNHDLTFQLLTGTKAIAQTIASGIFALDKGTTFGISTFLGGAVVGDTGTFQDYFTEAYDTVRQTYHFTKRRELYPFSGVSAFYSVNHSLELKEDGLCDVTEHADVQGALSFSQAQTQLDTLYANCYTRCNSFYANYSKLGIGTTTLVNTPTRVSKVYNRQGNNAAYDVAFTTSPFFKASGVSMEDVLDLTADEMNIVAIKHNYTLTANRRVASNTAFINMINTVTGWSIPVATGYYVNSSVYTAAWPLNLIKFSANWPYRTNRASVSMEYSNSPKYFVTVNGVPFNMVDYKITNTKPVDIINEYKVINRPTQFSVINYAYQTEKGQINVVVEGNLGRNPNEFYSGFRSGYGTQLTALYKYGIGVFMNMFANTTSVAFTYFLSDVKYTMNNDGVLAVSLTFVYTLKKYTL